MLGAVPSEAPRGDDWPCIRAVRVNHHHLGLWRRRSHLLKQPAVASRPQTGVQLADGGFAGIDVRPAPATAITIRADAALNVPIGGAVAISGGTPMMVVRLRPGGYGEAQHRGRESCDHPHAPYILRASLGFRFHRCPEFLQHFGLSSHIHLPCLAEPPLLISNCVTVTRPPFPYCFTPA